jgi:hypothetical protein
VRGEARAEVQLAGHSLRQSPRRPEASRLSVQLFRTARIVYVGHLGSLRFRAVLREGSSARNSRRCLEQALPALRSS